MVKETDSKSVGLCPRKFESCSCRFFILSVSYTFYFTYTLYNETTHKTTNYSSSISSSPISMGFSTSMCSPPVSIVSISFTIVAHFSFSTRNAYPLFPISTSTLGSRVCAGTQPVDSTEKMKSFRITFSFTRSRFSGRRMHSLHILSLIRSSLPHVQFRSFPTTSVGLPPISSISNTPMGQVLRSRSASSPVTGAGKLICGRILYAAVQTGDHLAWVSPMPFVA